MGLLLYNSEREVERTGCRERTLFILTFNTEMCAFNQLIYILCPFFLLTTILETSITVFELHAVSSKDSEIIKI